MQILIGLIAAMAVAGLGFYFVTAFNSLVRLRNDVDKAWSNVDVLLKQRHDELPKLLEACRGYMHYERQTLAAVTLARGAYAGAGSISAKALADAQVTGALRGLFAVAENYPQLKADANFLDLRNRITALEEEIADRREFFNDSVNTYNTRIRQLPDVFIALLLGLRRKPLFRAPEADRSDVAMNLAGAGGRGERSAS